MNKLEIIIGDKHFSSWSLRAWLMLKQCNVDFNEQIIQLGQPDTRQMIEKFSMSGKVPILKHGELMVWESLAIGEYLAEVFPAAGLWPVDLTARTIARAISNEMHAGFVNLRGKMPFDLLNKYELPDFDDSLLRDIRRVEQLWLECRAKFGAGGDFLFGKFGIADAMFAPVVLRFDTYGYIPYKSVIQDYCQAVIRHQSVQEWRKGLVV